MKFEEDKLFSLVEEISKCNEIDIRDIPCIDLYMDQITTFFDEKLGHLKRDEKDPILTKTMINNYTKDKVLIPPKSKKYSKEHMILLILIYNLKQILSINDIKSLLKPLLKDLEVNGHENISLDHLYSTFIGIKTEELDSFNKDFENRLKRIKDNLSEKNKHEYSKHELLLVVLTLISQAYAQKRLAEKIIDSYFKQSK